jgi:hypothetical protein
VPTFKEFEVIRMEEIIIYYPIAWENEYRLKGLVSKWFDEFPKLYDDYLNKKSLSCNPGTLDLFAQYALMYLIKKNHGFHSLTWFKMGLKSQKSKNWERSQKCWHIMSKCMGSVNFERLRSSILDAGLGGDGGFRGEPDLFCWKPGTGDWYFAEAKKSDSLGKYQYTWFHICEKVTGHKVKIYRLYPGHQYN